MAGIVDQTLIRRFIVDDSVKLNSANYYDVMDKTFYSWYKSNFCILIVPCVFMHDVSPSYVSNLTREFIEHERFTREKIIIFMFIKTQQYYFKRKKEWPPSSPDQNLTENLWSIMKMKLC